jgi:ATP-dependent Clp protease protease subunit
MKWSSPSACVASYTFGKVADRVRVSENDVFFTSEVDTDSIDLLLNEITKIADKSSSSSLSGRAGKDGPVRVTLYVDSPGGMIKDIFKFVDYVRILRRRGRIHLTTVIVGLAASAATIMASMGDVRYVTSSSTCMIHELSAGNYGTFTHLTSEMKNIKHLHDTIVDIYVSANSKVTRESLSDMLLKETWFTSQEYVEAGFADSILM